VELFRGSVGFARCRVIFEKDDRDERMKNVVGWRLEVDGEKQDKNNCLLIFFVCRLGHFACGQRDFSSRKFETSGGKIRQARPQAKVIGARQN
jgi:hypothetical protein